MEKFEVNTIEKALTMYKETVSPETNCLRTILSQIPERKIIEHRRAVRSPYTWLAITELVMVCSMLLTIFPTMKKISQDPFYQIDKRVEIFEKNLQKQDLQANNLEATL